MKVSVEPSTGDHVCEHGTAVDVHCCNCHSGFLFDIDSCVCGEPMEHMLTLKFGRVLTKDEWREIADAASKLPHVQALEANAKESGDPTPAPDVERLLPLEICDGHDVGNRPLSCINCARQLGRKEGAEAARVPSHLLGEDEPCETCGSRLCNCECPAKPEPNASTDVGRLIERLRTKADKMIGRGPRDEDRDILREAADTLTALQDRETPKPVGFTDGVLYCYGGCGQRYVDFALDVILPTPLWNQIAVGPPFDETQIGIEREGRGGVLCASCIAQRLKALPGVTVAFMTTDAHDSIIESYRHVICDYGERLREAEARQTVLRQENEQAHQRLNETRVADTAHMPLRERVDKIITLLSWERDEKTHIIEAIGAEKDELRARAKAAEHRRAAAEYRATRVELDKELLKRAEQAERTILTLTAQLADQQAIAEGQERVIALLRETLAQKEKEIAKAYADFDEASEALYRARTTKGRMVDLEATVQRLREAANHARDALKALDIHGGLGFDKHAWIQASLTEIDKALASLPGDQDT